MPHWNLAHYAMYRGHEWEQIDSVNVPTAPMAEKAVKRMAKEVIALDDARFGGPGTPVNTVIRITYYEEN